GTQHRRFSGRRHCSGRHTEGVPCAHPAGGAGRRGSGATCRVALPAQRRTRARHVVRAWREFHAQRVSRAGDAFADCRGAFPETGGVRSGGRPSPDGRNRARRNRTGAWNCGMTPTADDDFRPSWWLRSAHLQSMLDCGDGVRLAGCHTAQNVAAHARGLAVLFHGWEGSTRSTYLLQTGARLLEEGWDVFRLNFRDHGDTHALNPGIFHSCRIDEVVGALREVQRRYPTRPMALVGFSLGGNFALRAALRAPDAGIELAHVVAVCPVIDPHAGLFQLEHAPRMYHDYFMWKWRRSLKLKQRAFADAE